MVGAEFPEFLKKPISFEIKFIPKKFTFFIGQDSTAQITFYL